MIKSLSRVFLCTLLSLTGPVLPSGAVVATSADNADISGMPQIAFEKYTLSNGLQVILHVDHSLPLVYVNEWYHVGSKNEPRGREGFAHLFEHLMFQGSKNAPGDYFGYIGKAGANIFAGGVNGTTETDRTLYFATVPSGNLEFVLWLESDRLATLADALTQKKLDNQRAVVENELRQTFENQPYGRALVLLPENLYPTGHPYSWPAIGNKQDLDAASLEDVRQFFRTYYTPNNLSLVVAGDFDPSQVKRLIEKYFGSIPPGPPLTRMKHWVPRIAGERILDVSDQIRQERLYIAWVSPPVYGAGDADLEVAARILVDGISSRLQRALIYDHPFASDVAAFQSGGEIAGMFVITADARAGEPLSDIEQAITAQIAKLASTGPTAEELARAKTQIESRFIAGLENVGGFAGVADRLNEYNTYLGDPGRFGWDLARYRHTSIASVRDAVRQWLARPDRLLVRYHPVAFSGASPVALDRSISPPLRAERPFIAPHVQSGRLENGLQIFVIPRPELPTVAVMLASRAGSMADPAGKSGLAAATAALLERGTKTRSATEIENALGNLGTSLSVSTTTEASELTFQTLDRNFIPALSILADVVRNPAFPQKEVILGMKLDLAGLAQQASNPVALASRIGGQLLFGREHPYGRPIDGLPGTVAAVTREDLIHFHQKEWTPGNSALIFVGDITLARALALAGQDFGSWAARVASPTLIPPPRPAAGKVFVVDRPGAAQTYAEQLLPAPPRDSRDYYALTLANAVWGGALPSRLYLNLRQDKGYTYGIFSFLISRSRGGEWLSQGGVQTDKTVPSVVELDRELANLSGDKPITEQELATSRTTLIRGYAQSFRTSAQLLAQAAQLWTLRLPMSEMQRFPSEIERVTLQQVNEAAQRYAKPDKARLLLIGDYATFRASLEKLDLGKVTVLDAEGRPVP